MTSLLQMFPLRTIIEERTLEKAPAWPATVEGRFGHANDTETI